MEEKAELESWKLLAPRGTIAPSCFSQKGRSGCALYHERFLLELLESRGQKRMPQGLVLEDVVEGVLVVLATESSSA